MLNEVGKGCVILVSPSAWDGCMFKPDQAVRCEVLYSNDIQQFYAMPLDEPWRNRLNWRYVSRQNIIKILGN
jgi:hypothetical protein